MGYDSAVLPLGPLFLVPQFGVPFLGFKPYPPPTNPAGSSVAARGTRKGDDDTDGGDDGAPKRECWNANCDDDD